MRYAETDQMGVVYYANYFVWFEVGRTDLLRDAAGATGKWRATVSRCPSSKPHCEYRRPARYDDELEVRTTGVLLSPVRLRFDYRVVRPVDAATVAEGHTVHASLDRNGRPARLPARAREVFER